MRAPAAFAGGRREFFRAGRPNCVEQSHDFRNIIPSPTPFPETMKAQVEAAELMERIRREARRQQAKAYPAPSPAAASGDADGLPLPAVPALASVQPAGFSSESLLAQVGNMLDRARDKTTVHKGVPKLLRQFYRNQGGYNDIVLEALQRLREANRLLTAENIQFRLHIQRQTEWMQAAEHKFTRLEKRFDEFRARYDLEAICPPGAGDA